MGRNKKSQSKKNVNINVNVIIKTDKPQKTNKVELAKNITLLVGGLINLILAIIRLFA